jgi:type VI secretion system secreted protein VgrG
MLSGAHEPSLTLQIVGLEHDLRVLAFTAKESISRPYSVRIELVSERADLTPEALLHRHAFLGFDAEGNGLHGQISEVAQGDCHKRLTHYFLQLSPGIQRLEYRRNQRIFQGKSVPEIIALVLKDHAILADDFVFRLREPCKPRIYCTQYQETDLHFVRRLCEEEGIHFHFQHSRDRHLLVFADDPIQLPQLPQPIIYLHDSGLVAQSSVVRQFSVRLATRSGKAARHNYHFEIPRVDLLSSASGQGRKELEDYHYPAPFNDRSVGDRQAQKTLERNRSDHRLASGTSDQPALISGHLFELEHPNPDWNQQWLVTAVIHEGKQPQVLEEFTPTQTDPGAFTQGYRNAFEAIPGNVPFRPPLRHAKTRILGSQHGVVTGPPGEEVHCDEYGRIKVSFFWDREGGRNEHSSCWLRVATGWAHDQYGTAMIPRVGMEVIVGYFEADPDQPYVQGCLPNADTRVPLNLPSQKTQTVLKTQSTPGGAGFNELRIEDRKGAESVAIRAQRDWSEHVLNDQTIQVDNQRKVLVTGLSSHELHGQEHHLTHGARKTRVLGDDSLAVVGSQHVSTANHLVNAAQQIHLACGQHMILDATLCTSIKAGGHWISISPAGIFTSVPILLGGAPLAGIPAVPLPPDSLEKRVASPGPASAPLSEVSVLALREEFQTHPARCEACEAARSQELAQGGEQ